MTTEQEPALLQRVMHVRVPSADWQGILTISNRLDLKISEIVRRALRIGLATLTKTELPGGKDSSGVERRNPEKRRKESE